MFLMQYGFHILGTGYNILGERAEHFYSQYRVMVNSMHGQLDMCQVDSFTKKSTRHRSELNTLWQYQLDSEEISKQCNCSALCTRQKVRAVCWRRLSWGSFVVTHSILTQACLIITQTNTRAINEGMHTQCPIATCTLYKEDVVVHRDQS